MEILAASHRGPVVLFVTKGSTSIAIDDIIQILIMRPNSHSLSYSQTRIIDTDVIGDNEVISKNAVSIVCVCSNANSMFLIAKREIIVNHRGCRGMPEINPAASIIVNDIIENMTSGCRMIDGMHILTQLGVGFSNVINHIANNVIIMSLIIVIVNA